MYNILYEFCVFWYKNSNAIEYFKEDKEL